MALKDLGISAISVYLEEDNIVVEEPAISSLIEAEASFTFAYDKPSNLIEDDDFPTAWNDEEDDAIKRIRLTSLLLVA